MERPPLDASLDAEVMLAIRKAIDADPAVAALKWATGRNAGRFRFAEAGVALRVAGTDKAEAAVARIEGAVTWPTPHAAGGRAKGIRVAEWLVANKVDVVMRASTCASPIARRWPSGCGEATVARKMTGMGGRSWEVTASGSSIVRCLATKRLQR